MYEESLMSKRRQLEHTLYNTVGTELETTRDQLMKMPVYVKMERVVIISQSRKDHLYFHSDILDTKIVFKVVKSKKDTFDFLEKNFLGLPAMQFQISNSVSEKTIDELGAKSKP